MVAGDTAAVPSAIAKSQGPLKLREDVQSQLGRGEQGQYALLREIVGARSNEEGCDGQYGVVRVHRNQDGGCLPQNLLDTKIISQIPASGGRPDELAALVPHLCLCEAAFVTGPTSRLTAGSNSKI